MQDEKEKPGREEGDPIHINPAHKGLFTAKANKAKMSVQEFANHVMANKGKYSEQTVQQANFARNASKFSH
jgi:hypothetical protein